MAGHDRFLTKLLVIVGIALRLRLYLQNDSLWWDEAALASNLQTRSYGGLLESLDYQQAAPVAFMWMSKAITGVLGDAEMMLRLLPLLCGLASVVVFYRLASRLLDGVGLPVAVGLFALSAPLLRYSVELKPYSVDLLCALVVTSLAYTSLAGDERGSRTRALGLLALLGAAIVWVSNAAPLVLAGAGIALVVDFSRRRELGAGAAAASACVLWLASFAAAYAVYLRAVAANPYFQEFWSGRVAYAGVPERGAFLPLPTSFGGLQEMGLWLLHAPFELLANPVGVPLRGVAFLLLVIGTVESLRARPSQAALLLLPAAFALALSAWGLYPFSGRFLLFFAPASIVMIAHGTRPAVASLPGRSRLVTAVLVALLFVDPSAPLLRFKHKPGHVDLRPALEFVARTRSANELVYVAYGAKPVLEYYASRIGFDADSVLLQVGSVFEPSSEEKLAMLVDDIERLRGHLAWVVLTYIPRVEREAMIAELARMGTVWTARLGPEVQVYYFIPA